MTIPTIPYEQLLKILKGVKSSGAVFIADKDKPPHIEMYEESQQRRRQEEDDDDDDDDDYYYSCCRRHR